jgi:hypothetical protein
LLAQGLRSIYDDDNEYIELPKAMERAFRAAIDAKAVLSDIERKSYCGATRRPDSELWHEAMVREMEAHLENGTWELVKLPHGRKAIGSKWVFKVKRNPDGTVKCYKAHLVAKGFGQRPGVNFDEMFAPTTKWAALHAILTLATLKNLELESIDISNTYLNSELHKVNVYMQQPRILLRSKVCSPRTTTSVLHARCTSASTSTHSTCWIALALQTAVPSSHRSTPAHASTCPSARRRLRTMSSCATNCT